MKKIKKLLSIFLVVVLSLGVLALFGCNKADKPVNELNENSVIVKPAVSNGIEIVTLNSEVVESETGVYLSKVLKATVTPANAPDKTVTWSVAWSDTTKTDNVEDYVTVTPESSGSTVAEVRCYQGFDGDIIITVKTNVGEFTATCLVSFVGYPTTLNILSDGNIVNGNVIDLDLGQDCSFDIALANAINNVGAEFGDYEITTSFNGVLSIDAYCCQNGITETTEKTNFSVNLALNPYVYFDCPNHGTTNDTYKWPSYQHDFNFSDYLTVTVSGNKVNVHSTGSMLENYNTPVNRTGYHFKLVDVVEPIYYVITVTEKNSKVSNTVKINILPSVTDVDLDSSELVF